MRRMVTCFILLSITLQVFAQNRDSLRLVLTAMKDDTAKVLKYYEYGDLFSGDISDTATLYYDKGKALAEKLDFKRGIGAYASHYIVILNNRGEYGEALQLTKEALIIFKTLGDKKELSAAYLNIGSNGNIFQTFNRPQKTTSNQKNWQKRRVIFAYREQQIIILQEFFLIFNNTRKEKNMRKHLL